MPVAFELPVRAADENVRHVEVQMLIRVAHVGAIHDQRVIEQRALAVGNRLELLGEVRERRHVIAIDVGVALHLHGIVLMVRRAVESGTDAPVGEEVALREDIRAPGQIASAEQRGHTRDVRAEGQRRQVELQLDVLVERIGNPRRQIDLRNRPGRLRGKLDAPLDLADFVGVLIDRPAV